MGKRMEDQRRDDSSSSSSSSSSDASWRRRPRHYQNWKTSSGTLTLNELKDAIQQDKDSTEAKFNRKIEKLKQKRRKDKRDNRILKEDIRILKEGYEDLKSKFEKMQKGGCAEVHHDKASPSQRSQLCQSTRFQLVIENSVSETIYKNETVETKDGGGHIKVIMYDGDNPIAPDHPLASVKVDLVVIEGRFNDKRDSWSKEEFEKSIITPREGIIRLVKNGTFHLIGGICDHQGATIMDNSQKKEVKLGVRIAVLKKERVLEGVSNPFRVQEVKTKRSQKNGKQSSLPIPMRILGQPTSAYSTQHGQARNGNSQNFCQENLGQMFGQSTSATPMQHGQVHTWPSPNDLQATGQTRNNNDQNFRQEILAQTLGQSTSTNPMQHGQTRNSNDQNFRQEILAQMLGQSTSTNPMQHGQVHTSPPPNILQAAGQAPNDNGQNFRQEIQSQMLWQPTSTNPMQHGQGPVSPLSQHSSPPPVIQYVLQTSVNQQLPAQDTSFRNGSSELAHQNPSAEVLLNDNEIFFGPL